MAKPKWNGRTYLVRDYQHPEFGGPAATLRSCESAAEAFRVAELLAHRFRHIGVWERRPGHNRLDFLAEWRDGVAQMAAR